MDHKQRVREASARYYRNHTSDIIAHKTLQKVRRTGRIPRPATIEAHGIDEEQLREELYEFTKRHPDALATKRICRAYQIL
jgi:DNA-nicking Smr family endonuclease